MTMTLQDPATEQPSTTSAQRLRWITTAVRVSLRWFGVRKTLTPEQKSEAALPFGAEGEFLSARKKLLDTRHPAYQDVTAVRGKVLAYWKATTLPYPEPGIRLLRHTEVEAFHERLGAWRTELHEAVARLDEHYAELKQTARQRLGRLYNPADYPSELQGLFVLDWEFPSVEPPDYLLQLSPALYEQERNRVAARFEEAVQLAEQAFLSEFARLVAHLSERLNNDETGTRKVFRDTAITNLLAFFDRFRQLNVRSNADLDALIEQAEHIVQGVEPQHLRDQDTLRQHVATQLSSVQAVLDGLLVDQPRRRIIRSSPSNNGARHAADH
jgi:hypothetical protein